MSGHHWSPPSTALSAPSGYPEIRYVHCRRKGATPVTSVSARRPSTIRPPRADLNKTLDESAAPCRTEDSAGSGPQLSTIEMNTAVLRPTGSDVALPLTYVPEQQIQISTVRPESADHSLSAVSDLPTASPEEGEVVDLRPLLDNTSGVDNPGMPLPSTHLGCVDADQISLVSDSDDEEEHEDEYRQTIDQCTPGSSVDKQESGSHREKTVECLEASASLSRPRDVSLNQTGIPGTLNGAISDKEDRFPFWTPKVQARSSSPASLGATALGLIESNSSTSPRNDVIVFKMSNVDLSTNSLRLQEFVYQFLPYYRDCLTTSLSRCDPQTEATGHPPCLTEVFLLQSQLTAQSLQLLLDSFAAHNFLPTALHLGSNPQLGPESILVLADFIRQSREPLRWLALSKCNITVASLQKLLGAVLARADIYPRVQHGESVPLWLDLPTTLEDTRDTNSNNVDTSTTNQRISCPLKDKISTANIIGPSPVCSGVFEYLNSIREGLYCHARNRLVCGINRCGTSGAVFHIPKLAAAATGANATSLTSYSAHTDNRNDGSSFASAVDPARNSVTQHVILPMPSGNLSSLTSIAEPVHYDGQMSEIDTEDDDDEENWQSVAAVEPPEQKPPCSDVPICDSGGRYTEDRPYLHEDAEKPNTFSLTWPPSLPSFPNGPQCVSAEHTLTGESPLSPVSAEGAPEVTLAVESTAATPGFLPSSLSLAYHSLLRDAFLSLSVIAADRQIFPADFLRDLATVYLDGRSFSDVPAPTLWQALPPYILSEHLLTMDNGTCGAFSLSPRSRKRHRQEYVDAISFATQHEELHTSSGQPSLACPSVASEGGSSQTGLICEPTRFESSPHSEASSAETVLSNVHTAVGGLDRTNISDPNSMNMSDPNLVDRQLGASQFIHPENGGNDGLDETMFYHQLPLTPNCGAHDTGVARDEDHLSDDVLRRSSTSSSIEDVVTVDDSRNYAFHATDGSDIREENVPGEVSYNDNGFSQQAGAEEGEIQDDSFVVGARLARRAPAGLVSRDSRSFPSFVREKIVDPHSSRLPRSPRNAPYSYPYARDSGGQSSGLRHPLG